MGKPETKDIILYADIIKQLVKSKRLKVATNWTLRFLNLFYNFAPGLPSRELLIKMFGRE